LTITQSSHILANGYTFEREDAVGKCVVAHGIEQIGQEWLRQDAWTAFTASPLARPARESVTRVHIARLVAGVEPALALLG
jgi:hypothetical protein